MSYKITPLEALPEDVARQLQELCPGSYVAVPSKRRQTTQALRRRVVLLYREGTSAGRIARVVDRSERYVRQIIADAGATRKAQDGAGPEEVEP